ncbi:MAG: response regulator [Gammaproteobacteria bacterium]|nr:response regulator [Gammaproteobacteria bacterium]NIR85931.1 response regulator [Gammaproteobacteria bacterium]NIR91923.1 response regulator [Gammaproteobacteria bacterium]NIU07180.1 response regulator [Gammaproteobacteria bacterium]NIV53993.1 response regulator [Gammaproteobacteria bacterium]
MVDGQNPSALAESSLFLEGKKDVPQVIISNGEDTEGPYTVRRPFIATRLLRLLDEVVTNEILRSRELFTAPHAKPRDKASAGQAKPADNTKTPAAEVTEKAVSKKSPADVGNGAVRALVVDDSLPVRRQVGMALQKNGIEADFAEDGESALKLFKNNAYDIVFLDVVMPGVDGYEVCKTIKRDKARKDVPVIMLTGKSSPFDKVKGKLSGCDTYLTKPVSLQDFNRTLTRCLSYSIAFKTSGD